MMQQLLNNTRSLAIGTYKHETDCKYPVILSHVIVLYMYYLHVLYPIFILYFKMVVFNFP